MLSIYPAAPPDAAGKPTAPVVWGGGSLSLGLSTRRGFLVKEIAVSPRLAAAGARSLVDTDLEVADLAISPATEDSILIVNAFQELRDKAHGLLVALPIGRADAEHELIGALALLGPLEEPGATAAEAELGSRGLGNCLHVLPVRPEDLPGDLESGLLFDADEELALRLRHEAALRRAAAVGLLRLHRGGAFGRPRLLRPPIFL